MNITVLGIELMTDRSNPLVETIWVRSYGQKIDKSHPKARSITQPINVGSLYFFLLMPVNAQRTIKNPNAYTKGTL